MSKYLLGTLEDIFASIVELQGLIELAKEEFQGSLQSPRKVDLRIELMLEVYLEVFKLREGEFRAEIERLREIREQHHGEQ